MWLKSSYSSDGTHSQCVEVAQLTDVIGIRDSKDPDSGHLVLSPAEFANLVLQIKNAII
ncbi:DUF397 domain-containing protein [Actinomadura xylanilytica]|uniref:DUF397 domain-containing protein n=1 Tax=Actinomadura xylanilytica TaxID=887459 RepID=UPI00255B3621|nr:DUF397 domain-containing protein [Actinomadura xylanilytica]MDL4777731.1 DUF397 domain-containing protein [Actinomadura xylanilytica]